MKDIIRYSIVLFMICLVSGGILGLIYSIAEPRIIEQLRLEEQRAIAQVLPQAAQLIEKIEEEDLVFYRAKDARGRIFAYVVIAQAYGYSSEIKTVAALKPNGDIIAVRVLRHAETPGIGSQITGDDFLNQFNNKHIDEQFDTITGATISSSAVIDSVKQAAEKVLKFCSNH